MLDIIFGIILLVAAVFLIVAVLMQSGKAHNLSGTIAGGAETFFGKTKGKTIDRLLSKITTIVAIVFVIIVVIVYVKQDDNDLNALVSQYEASQTTASSGSSSDDGLTGTVVENAGTTDPEASSAAE